ncbi:MAG: hypothetical protein DRP13_00330 [Candidatus Aenigmatarchaeota archaeon]|nr:MAG: hypothetical protein DRP16_00055 [Candidatus Aenigmarchaeota archaeon]RLJ09286.1 MAG: hypothetical protein DRP13_00330 [Candidatus Aenigmarchaeota archaeon]
MTGKLVFTWIMGSFFLLAGVWIVRNLEMNIGVNEFQYLFALIIAFVLILVAGLCWISVAVATRHEVI